MHGTKRFITIILLAPTESSKVSIDFPYVTDKECMGQGDHAAEQVSTRVEI